MNLLVVDLSSVAYPAWHASSDKPVGFMYEVTVDRVRREAKQFDRVVVACDTGRCFRHDLDTQYKAGRQERDPAMLEQLRRIQATLEGDGFWIAKADGFEADDCVGAVATWAIANVPDVQIGILSSDKDLLQLCGPAVRVRSVATNAVLGPEEVLAKLGVRPNQVVDYLALTGDSSDNIRGVPGVGPKHAARLLGQFGTLSGIIEALDGKDDKDEPLVRPPGIHAAISGALRDGSLVLARQLVALRTDVPLDFAGALEVRAPKPQRPDFGNDLEEPVKEKEEQQPVANGSMSLPEPSAAMVRAEPVATLAPSESRWALEPRTMQHAVWLAGRLFESRLFAGYGQPEQVLAVILAGREMGLGAMTSLRDMHIVKGKVTMSASLMVGLCFSSGKAEHFDLVETTPKSATYVTKRKGSAREVSMTFTIEQAKQAGLLAPSRSGEPTQWDKDPENMLRHRCSSRLARAVYPDVVSNCYLPEELEDA